MFTSVLTEASVALTVSDALTCIAASLVLGVIVSLVFSIRVPKNKNFMITLALLPLIVQVIIMLVNGSLGTGVAIMGAFTLVRFRSQPGNSREILSVMCAMAIGLATGMGYITFAVVFTAVICVIWLALAYLPFGRGKVEEKELRITIPENLDYTGIFDEEFKTYTIRHSLERVRTTNMGSLYELRYYITVKDVNKEKELIDALRCKNGNLPIICGRIPERNSLL